MTSFSSRLTPYLGLAFAFLPLGHVAAQEEDPRVEVTVQTVPLTRAILHEVVTAYGRIEPAPA